MHSRVGEGNVMSQSPFLWLNSLSLLHFLGWHRGVLVLSVGIWCHWIPGRAVPFRSPAVGVCRTTAPAHRTTPTMEIGKPFSFYYRIHCDHWFHVDIRGVVYVAPPSKVTTSHWFCAGVVGLGSYLQHHREMKRCRSQPMAWDCSSPYEGEHL